MRAAAVTVFAFLLLAPSAFAAGNPEIAALQVGLRQKGLYAGTVDGVLGGGPAPRHQCEATDQPGVDRVEELPDGDLVDQLTTLLSRDRRTRPWRG